MAPHFCGMCSWRVCGAVGDVSCFVVEGRGAF